MFRPVRMVVSCCAAALLPAALAQSVTVGGTTFANKGLQGVGRVDNAKKDKFGETFGSLSGLALDLRTWQRSSSTTYAATLYTQPDRGYVKSGVTTGYRARTHRLAITFKPDTNGSSNQDQLTLTLSDTTLLTESDGRPLTGMDPSATTSGTRAGITPRLPQAFTGNLSIDPEGLVLLPDGTFFISDEYGPYVYRFSASGILLGAIRPPEALIPKRNNQDSFSSDNPASGQPAASPSDPIAGRANNKGFEGLSLSADGRTLYALMQSATRQDTSSGQNRFARLLAYDITTPAAPALTGEWVLPLPLFSANPQDVAESHEIRALDSRRFLVLAHDGNGRGATITKSTYRAVLVYDIANSTNIAGGIYDSPASPLAQNGILANNITPATSGVLVDMNDATQLARFSLNNNSNDNSDTLASAWESLALAPALDVAAPDDFFLFIGNDNNFSTNNGFQDGASYSASPNVDTMVLVYRVTLPGTLTTPSIITQPSNVAATLGQNVTLTVTASANPAPTYQWSKGGVPIANATGATLTITNAQTADTGSYSVLVGNANGSVASAAVSVSVAGANAPLVTAQPVAQTVAAGSTVAFSVSTTGSPPLTYQWLRSSTQPGAGTAALIPGATSATLVLTGTTGSNASLAANYSVIVTNAFGAVTSNLATLSIATTDDPGRLTNLSVLTDVTADVPSFTVGTVIVGTGTKPLVVRAAGPSIAAVTGSSTGLLTDPKLDLFAAQTVVATNDNWGGDSTLAAAMAGVGAFPFSPPNSKDAAVYLPALPVRDYTVVVTGVGGAAGLALAEIYDASPAGTFTSASPRLVNVSVRKQIAAGGSLTLGFTLGGAVAKTVLIRVIGPGLAAVGLTSGTLGDPQLTLFDGGATAIATNDDWGADPQFTSTGSRVGAFSVGSAPTKDAMLITTLPPGGYTARATGNAGTGGLAIVEVYEVP